MLAPGDSWFQVFVSNCSIVGFCVVFIVFTLICWFGLMDVLLLARLGCATFLQVGGSMYVGVLNQKKNPCRMTGVSGALVHRGPMGISELNSSFGWLGCLCKI